MVIIFAMGDNHGDVRKANLPIIFLTGYDREQVLDASELISHSDILTKLVDFDVLHRRISQRLDCTNQ